jgi:rhomboid protease GluP
MFKRQTSGSVVCPACGKLVGVNDAECFHCGRQSPGLWGYGPLLRKLGQDLGVTQIVLWGCGALYVLSLLLDAGQIRLGDPFSFLSPSRWSLIRLGASGAAPVFEGGRWWTLLSAGWLHGGLLHILFNMLWVRQLAPATTLLYGAGRTMIIYTLSSIAGFALSSFGGVYLSFLRFPMGGAPWAISVGASAAIFGLLGALVYAGRRGVSSHMGRQAWIYAIILFVFGLMLPGVDNWAHLGGFGGGYLVAMWLNPLEPERADHLFGALAALVLTLLAVLFSFATTLSFG